MLVGCAASGRASDQPACRWRWRRRFYRDDEESDDALADDDDDDEEEEGAAAGSGGSGEGADDRGWADWSNESWCATTERVQLLYSPAPPSPLCASAPFLIGLCAGAATRATTSSRSRRKAGRAIHGSHLVRAASPPFFHAPGAFGSVWALGGGGLGEIDQ